MGKVFINDDNLYDIADAIRDKLTINSTMYPHQMPDAINMIKEYNKPKKYNFLCFTAEQANSTVYIRSHIDIGIELQYSYDGETWVDWNSTVSGTNDVFDTITLSNIGDKVYIRGNNGLMSRSQQICSTFVMSGRISASGDVLSLLSYTCSQKYVCEYCFSNLFASCTSLITAPELSSTYLSANCYMVMFSGCTSLTTAPELPATTLAANCYQYMFQGCTSLTTAPELPATTLASSCYYGMFQGCTSLTTAPELPATVKTYCYALMFKGCTSLTTAPELPSTTLQPYCYQYMFSGCTSLTTAPELPAVNLENYCYQYMFENCTSLTTAPDLLVTTLVSNCCGSMFNGCTSLNYINVGVTSWNTNNSLNWVQGVSSTGTFIKPNGTTITSGMNGIPSGWTVYDAPSVVYNCSTNYCTITTDIPNATIYYTTDGTKPTTSSTEYTEPFYVSLPKYSKKIYMLLVSPSIIINSCGYIENLFYIEAIEDGTVKYNGQTNSFKYSKDCINWTNYTNNTDISVLEGEKVFFKKYANLGYVNNNRASSYKFTFSNKVNIGGCLSLLSHGECKNGIYSSNSGYFGSYLFYNCTTLINAGNLIVNCEKTGTQNYGCDYMFYGCTSLTTAPELPATTLINYCYQYMFYGCTSLTTAPELPATQLRNYCYQYMFYGCTSLTNPPELPATLLVQNCYAYMFNGCTSLTTAPELPATTLSPNCYQYMFKGCTSLNYINVGATSWNTTNASNWVQNVSSTGTFVKPSNTSITSGTSGIPSGWTVQNI